MQPEIVKSLEYATTQEAWEGINEYILNNQPEIESRMGGRYGPGMCSYCMFIRAREAWIDPEFDLGKIFGYQIHKWSSLVNNYVDFDALDLVRTQVREREAKNSTSYNISYLFSNSHTSGKGCLLSLTFQKRLKAEYPVLVMNLRASEVTKRLIFDYILVQRIAEYVYGEGCHVSVEVFCANTYLSAEHFSMYDNYKGIPKLIRRFNRKNKQKLTSYQNRVLQILERFKEIDPAKIKYKSHLRSVKQLQRGDDGEPISGIKSMKTKTLIFKQ